MKAILQGQEGHCMHIQQAPLSEVQSCKAAPQGRAEVWGDLVVEKRMLLYQELRTHNLWHLTRDIPLACDLCIAARVLPLAPRHASSIRD